MPTVWIGLAIETGSDPIEGSVDTGNEEPQSFHGWVELAAAIETVRAAPEPRATRAKD